MTNDLSTIARVAGTDERIRDAVLKLAGATGATVAQMCRAAGIKRSTLYTRLSSDPEHRRSFQPSELDGLAELFDIDVSVFFHGVDLEPAGAAGYARLVPRALARPWEGLLLPGERHLSQTS